VALELNLLRRTVGGVEARVGVDGLRFADHGNCCFLAVTPTRWLHSLVMFGWRVGGGGGVVARFFGGGRELRDDCGRVNEEPMRVNDAVGRAKKACVKDCQQEGARGQANDSLEDERRERDGNGVEQHPDLLRRDPSREPFCEFRSTVALIPIGGQRQCVCKPSCGRTLWWTHTSNNDADAGRQHAHEHPLKARACELDLFSRSKHPNCSVCDVKEHHDELTDDAGEHDAKGCCQFTAARSIRRTRNNPLAARFYLLRVGTDSTTGHTSSDRLHDERDEIGSDEEGFECSPREPAHLRRDVGDGEPGGPVQCGRVEGRRDDEAADLEEVGVQIMAFLSSTRAQTYLHHVGGEVGGGVMRP
jgi:hypothetical protein